LTDTVTGVVCDLDGVLWRGDTVLPGVTDALTRLVVAGREIVFVTNNASKTPADVVNKISNVCGVDFPIESVITSPMAAVTMISSFDSPVMVVGVSGITEVVAGAGFHLTADPTEARTVMVGMDPGFDYGTLAGASNAVRAGARFLAMNTDPSYPIDGGLLPGAGALVAAIATASGREPEIAGKPYQPMRDLIKSRLPGPVMVIGDKVETDIAMALAEPDWSSILVMTGVTSVGADTSSADHVVAGMAEAVDLLLG
jgi:glycerol-1-phosphatase